MDFALGPLAALLLLLLFHGQQDFDIHHLIKVSGDAV
jgi:hypothetical protein